MKRLKNHIKIFCNYKMDKMDISKDEYVKFLKLTEKIKPEELNNYIKISNTFLKNTKDESICYNKYNIILYIILTFIIIIIIILIYCNYS